MRVEKFEQAVVSTSTLVSASYAPGRLVGMLISLSGMTFAGAESQFLCEYHCYRGSGENQANQLASLYIYLYRYATAGGQDSKAVYVPLDIRLRSGEIVSHYLGLSSGYAIVTTNLYFKD